MEYCISVKELLFVFLNIIVILWSLIFRRNNYVHTFRFLVDPPVIVGVAVATIVALVIIAMIIAIMVLMVIISHLGGGLAGVAALMFQVLVVRHQEEQAGYLMGMMVVIITVHMIQRVV